MKLFFKVIITGILSVLFVEIVVAVLLMTNILSVDTVQNNPILQYAFHISQDPTSNHVTFNPLFEMGIAIVFGIIPLISYFTKKS